MRGGDILGALQRGELAGIRELRLASLGLDVFPRDILDLAETLEVLDLSGNSLAALPEDFGRLRKLRAFFASGNPFIRLPPSLGACTMLSQIGFRGCGLREVPAEALPPRLRWLTLTDNALDALPDALGQCPHLQKLMLAGNRLRELPESLAGAARLELLRLSANRFETLPSWLGRLPRLAWLAWAGNPLDPVVREQATAVPWQQLQPGRLLGEGASGQVREALWRRPGALQAGPVALKLFKGQITSDGLPACEMAACLAAGAHPHLTGALGRITGHPEGRQGLLMPLLPEHWRVLADPPSSASCSRDVYPPDLRLTQAAALRIAQGAGLAATHLHACRMLHGDLYGHNLLWNGQHGTAVLSDFGAASFLPDGGGAKMLMRLEVRAWGLLLGELLERCDGAQAQNAALLQLQQACVQPDVSARPLMAEALAMLNQEGRPL
jgi:hypothetical protein